MTAERIAAAMLESAISVEAVTAARAKLAVAAKGEKKPKPPIVNQEQAERIGPGVYHVKNAIGLYLKKGEGKAL